MLLLIRLFPDELLNALARDGQGINCLRVQDSRMIIINEKPKLLARVQMFAHFKRVADPTIPLWRPVLGCQ